MWRKNDTKPQAKSKRLLAFPFNQLPTRCSFEYPVEWGCLVFRMQFARTKE